MTKPRILILLCLVLVLVIVNAWQNSPRQQHAASRKETERRPTTTGNNLKAKQSSTLDFSGGEQLAFSEPRLDLFRPLYPPPKRTAAKPPPKNPLPVKKPSPPPPPVPVTDQPPPPRTVQIPPYNVLGFLQKEDEISVFLASPQGEIFVVKEGDRFADNLLVKEVTPEHILVSRNESDPGRSFALGDGGQRAGQAVRGPSRRQTTFNRRRLTSGRPDIEAHVEDLPPGEVGEIPDEK